MAQTVLMFPNDPPAPSRGGMTPPLPRIDSLSAYGLRVARLLNQCRREGGRLTLLWVELALLAPPGRLPSDDERERLIHTASQRLRNRVRSADEALRVGENCFAVLLLGAGVDEAALVEHRLQQTLRGAYGLDNHMIQMAVRIGTAVFPEDGRQGDELAEAARSQLG